MTLAVKPSETTGKVRRDCGYSKEVMGDVGVEELERPLRDKAAMSALLARAVGNLRDAVLITDGEAAADGQRHIVFVNEAFTAMTGYAAEEAVGALPDITIGPATDRAALRKIQEARTALVPVRVELLKYRKDHSTFWVELDVVPVLDDLGRCTHWLGVMRDITERRESLLRLFETERMAAIGTLAAGVAHEINTPLAYVLMNLSFVREEIPELVATSSERVDELRAAITEIEQGVTRVAQIVKELRTFSQLDASQDGTAAVPSLLDGAVKVARAGMPGSAEIVVLCDGELPPVRCEPKRLSQVFFNVIVNALDAIPLETRRNRGVTICARRRGVNVVVTVADEGTGIPTAVLSRVFDPFFTTKPTGKRTGLGLSVAQAIVRAAGGTLTLESKPGTGTTVTIELPIVTTRDDAFFVPPLAVVAPGARSLSVLIVDDDELVARSLKRLIGTDHEVVVCHDGHEAVEVLERRRDFDLVISDLTMPGMSGAELYSHVEQRWPGFEKRFVILSGGACTESGRRLLARPSIRRLDKPLDMIAFRELLDRVRR